MVGRFFIQINSRSGDSVFAIVVWFLRTKNARPDWEANSSHRPLSRRLDRCDRVIQNDSRDPFGGNVYYVTMQITFLTRKFRNGERNLHCDVVHLTTTPDCNGVFAIKAYGVLSIDTNSVRHLPRRPSNNCDLQLANCDRQT